METNLLNRLQAMLLALATVGLVLLAVWNFHQESHFQQPDDGVWWSEAADGGGLVADKVLPNSPGRRAGIQPHDRLTEARVAPDSPAPRSDDQTQDLLNETGVTATAPGAKSHPALHGKDQFLKVNPAPIVHVADLERVLYGAGIYGKANYQITRDGIPLDTPVVVIPEPADRGMALGLRIIGLIYLAIGIYVLFRRWTAPRATHFYLFCLVSFALYALKYTGQLDALDKTVFWANVLAESLQPALFLHFALSFPEERLKNIRRRWLLPLVYAPGVGLLGLWLLAITQWQATFLLKHRLDQVGTAYLAIYYVLSAPAVEVAHARHPAGRGAVYPALRPSLPVRPLHAQPAHQAGRPVYRFSAPHLQLGHRALPLDGHRPDLQTRRGLHAGHGAAAGCLLRHHRAVRPGGPQRHAAGGARVGPGAHDSHRGRHLRAPQAQNPGLGGPRL
jgi:multisubunit Na+/H+ antiporter MnhB subunit